MDERVTAGGIFTILQRLCSGVFPLKMSQQFGFNGGASAPPRVAQMKEPAMCNGCVWHCAEPQGPGVNITWQCEKGGPKKGALLIPYSSLPCQRRGCAGFGRWGSDFTQAEPKESSRCDVNHRWRDGETCTSAGPRNRRTKGLNEADIERLFYPIWGGWTARKRKKKKKKLHTVPRRAYNKYTWIKNTPQATLFIMSLRDWIHRGIKCAHSLW